MVNETEVKKVETDFEKALIFFNAIRHKLDDEAVALFQEIFEHRDAAQIVGETGGGESSTSIISPGTIPAGTQENTIQGSGTESLAGSSVVSSAASDMISV